MKIVNKTLDVFAKEGITEGFFEEQINNHQFRCRKESPVWYSISREYRVADSNGRPEVKENETTLRAHISWSGSYGVPAPASRNFPNTWDGYKAACEWLDSKRAEFAESLL